MNLAPWFSATATTFGSLVALWLGLTARRREAVLKHESRMKAARQVVAVYRAPRSGKGARIDVVNGSGEIISEVFIEPMTERKDGQGVYPVWEFRSDSVSDRTIAAPYITAGAERHLDGAFWPYPVANQKVDSPVISIELDSTQVKVLIVWRDSHGEVWARQGGEEPYPSMLSVPGKDARGVIERRDWPDHWPRDLSDPS